MYEVTPDMIEAGLAALRSSGFLERESSADYALVQTVLEAALVASIKENGRILYRFGNNHVRMNEDGSTDIIFGTSEYE